MEKFKAFLKRKNIEISAKRYGIDALGAMAQGLFASLLVGTILSTLGTQLGICPPWAPSWESKPWSPAAVTPLP